MKISKIREIIFELEKDKTKITDNILGELFYSLTESSFLDLDIDIKELLNGDPRLDSYDLIKFRISDLQRRYNDLVLNNRFYENISIVDLGRKLEVGDIVLVRSDIDKSTLPINVFKYLGNRSVISDKGTLNSEEEVYRIDNDSYYWRSFMFSSVLVPRCNDIDVRCHDFISSNEKFAFWYLNNEEIAELSEVLGYLQELRLSYDDYLWKSVIKANLNLLVNAVACFYCKKEIDLDDMPKNFPRSLRKGIEFNEDLFDGVLDVPLAHEFKNIALYIPEMFNSEELRSEVSNYEFIKLLAPHTYYGKARGYLKRIQSKL